MYEINAPATLTAPGHTVAVNSGSGDYVWLTAVTGLDQATLRRAKDVRPLADGYVLHTSYRNGREISIEGLVVGSSVANRNATCTSLQAALEAIENADGTWSWTPTGGSLKTITVRCDIAIQFTGGQGGTTKNFIFGLVAADPTIS